MTTTTLLAELAPNHNLQISGRKSFTENRWREAILYYLFGVWSGNDDVMYRPKIMFGWLTLRLDRSTKRYYAYGEAADKSLPFPDPEHTLMVEDEQAEVEVGLARFVKDNSISTLYILFPESQSEVWLWKKGRRGEYGCCAVNVPVEP